MSRILISCPRDLASFINRSGHIQRLDEILEIGALAADVKTEALDHQASLNAATIKSTASPGSQPNFEESSTMEPVLGTRNRRTTPACGAYCLIFGAR